MTQQNKWRSSVWLISLIAGLGVGLGLLLVRGTGSLEQLELWAYDGLIRMQSDRADRETRIVLVTVTDRDIQHLGHWPLSDLILARAITRITAGQPRALGVDIYRDFPIPPGSEMLQEVLQQTPEVIFINKFAARPDERVPAPAVLEGTDQTGFADMLVDADGLVRRAALFLDDGEMVFYSLALRLALKYLEAEGIYPRPAASQPEYLALGAATLVPFESHDGGYVGADARGYQILLDYRAAPDGFLTVSLTDLLEDTIPPDTFTDRVVLLGVDAETVKDHFFTPLNYRLPGHHLRSRSSEPGLPMAGVLLHAHITSYLLRLAHNTSALRRTMPAGADAGWIMLWTLLGALAGAAATSLRQLAGLLGLGMVMLWMTAGWLFSYAWWVPVVPPSLGYLTSAGVLKAWQVSLEKRRWQALRLLFAKTVSEEVVQTVWQQREQLFTAGHLKPQRLTATVLFADLAGFSRIAETLSPSELMHWLNQVMGRLTGEVISHQGMVNKYVGDAILALFGAPLPRTTEEARNQDARNAVACARAIQAALIELNHQFQAENLPLAGMRIGIFTGSMIAGSLGGRERLEYTVIGEAVNTASRLESHAAESFVPDYFNHPCRILIGPETHQRVATTFDAVPCQPVRLKGIKQPVSLFEIK